MSTDRTSGDPEMIGGHLIGHVFPIREIHDCPLTHAQLFDRLLHLRTEFWEMNHDRLAHANLSVASS
jgi:hypothetical protein